MFSKIAKIKEKMTAAVCVMILIAMGVLAYYMVSIFVLVDLNSINSYFWKYFSNLYTSVICLVLGASASYVFFHGKQSKKLDEKIK